jgi:ubiquinone/menaquinone biosynthesis C-methylase UbiE
LEEKNSKAAGLDIFPKMIEVAEKRLKGRAELKVGDAEELKNCHGKIIVLI